jgi:hypothetical protein
MRLEKRRGGAISFAVVVLAGCPRREPPAPGTSPSTASPEFERPPATVVSASAAAPVSASARTASESSALLPQTRDMPHASGPAFEERVAALWGAIVDDDPERAMAFFFPLGAYAQVKDVASPAADWRHRLVAAYVQDIHALHNRVVQAGGSESREAAVSDGGRSPSAHGTDGGRYHLVGLEVPEARARWVEPGEEYNKIGYYRVFGSKLRYEVNGAPYGVEVKSLISWRGEWYVVHLSNIR